MKLLIRAGIALLVLALMLVFFVVRNQRAGHVAILSGNEARQPVEIVPGRYQGAECGMTLQQEEDSAQAVAPDGRTWFFDDPGCLALWLKTNRLRDEMAVWVYSRDTSAWIDGRKAWYSRTDNTPMKYGFAAYADSAEGFVDFDTMLAMMARDENLTNPDTRKKLLGNP